LVETTVTLPVAAASLLLLTMLQMANQKKKQNKDEKTIERIDDVPMLPPP